VENGTIFVAFISSSQINDIRPVDSFGAYSFGRVYSLLLHYIILSLFVSDGSVVQLPVR
jgi:hypothetical protein